MIFGLVSLILYIPILAPDVGNQARRFSDAAWVALLDVFSLCRLFRELSENEFIQDTCSGFHLELHLPRQLMSLKY